MYQDPHLITNMESHLARRIDTLGKSQDGHFRRIEALIYKRSSADLLFAFIAFVVGLLIGHFIF